MNRETLPDSKVQLSETVSNYKWYLECAKRNFRRPFLTIVTMGAHCQWNYKTAKRYYMPRLLARRENDENREKICEVAAAAASVLRQ